MVVGILVMGCRQEEAHTIVGAGPKIVKANGYLVPKDSVLPPKVLQREAPRVVPAIKNEMVTKHANRYQINKERARSTIVPELAILGEKGILRPKVVPAKGRVVMAGLPAVVTAQEVRSLDSNPYNFSSFNKLQGISDKDVQYIFEDGHDNIWFGTANGGVSMYDGHYFRTFTKVQGLLNNNITCITEDANGNIWFGSSSGITKYDGHSFTNFTVAEGLSSNHVTSMLVDKKGFLWIGSWNGGASRYDGETFTHYMKKEGLAENNVSTIMEDTHGNLWFGTDGNGISKYDGKSFHNYASTPEIYLEVVTCTLEDAHGNIWIGTQSGGLGMYDGASFVQYDQSDGLPNNFIFSIYEDTAGSIWIGTWGGGITQYDGTSFRHYPVLEGLSQDTVESIMEDSAGNIWFGTWGSGISKYSGQYFKHFTSDDGLLNSDVGGLLEDGNGNIWVGTYGGSALQYDGENFTQITEKYPGYGVLVNCITADKKGNIWFGSQAKGVIMYDGDNLTHFPEMWEMNRCRVMSMLVDTKGNLWIGTDFGGVIKYDGQASPHGKGSFTQFTDSTGLSSNMVTSIAEDRNGHLWFGTTGGGATQYDGTAFSHFTTKEGMVDNSLLSIYEDSRGNLWFGTRGAGVSKYDGEYFTHFTSENGLGGNSVTSILEDENGNLWFGTESGLSKLITNKQPIISEADKEDLPYEPENLFINYGHEDGFLGIGVNVGRTMVKGKNGAIWVGTPDRLTVFNPNDLKKDTVPPQLKMTNLGLFNETVHWADLAKNKDTSFILSNNVHFKNFEFDSVLKWNNVPRNLSLAHSNNNITFQYVGGTLKSPQKVRYQYLLEGFETNWNAPTSAHEATYGNLPWGDYIFKVKATNGDGVRSETLSYPFTIRAPWWHSWWAYLGYILVFVGGIVLLYRFQLHQKLKKAERVRLQELDTFKTGLYTNITHEFRTPLTVILGMAQQMYDSPKTHVKSGLDMILRNGQNLLSLVNQMLDLSKLESRHINLNYQQGDVVSFTHYVLESFQTLAEDKGVGIRFKTDVDQLIMDFDAVRLQQVISNLMANAIKFTPMGGDVILSTSCKKNHFILQIKDTGMGIAEADLPHIFDRFYQADGSHTRQGEGTGIGLALTQQLVKLFGGEVTVESKVGKGTVFNVSLPIRNSAEIDVLGKGDYGLPSSKDLKKSQSPEEYIGTSKEPRRAEEIPKDEQRPLVLIADDNEDVRAYIVSCLQGEYVVAIATNGKECEEMAYQLTPDMIILDVMMPHKDGFDVCRSLKTEERTSHIPIIMLTAKADMESKLQGLEQKADAYLTKPFHRKELLLRIKNLLELRELLQQYYLSFLEARSLPQGFPKHGSRTRVPTYKTYPTADEGQVHIEAHKAIPFANGLDNAFVTKVKTAVEAHLDDSGFDVEQLCMELALSHSQVHRKLSALTGLSATFFIRYVRLIKAKELLLHSHYKISAIATDCGFNDPAYFSRVFKKEFGSTPQKWRDKHAQ